MSNNLANILTNTGLNLPEQYTEAEFFEAGRFLANVEHGLQWAVGDWYNGIRDKYGDKKAACEKAGLDYKTANTYAKVASSFEGTTRVGGLSFAHHQRLAIDDLSDSQRFELLQQAKDKQMSSKQLTTARDLLLGRDTVKPGSDLPSIEEVKEQPTAIDNTEPVQASDSLADEEHNPVVVDNPAVNTTQPEQSYDATFEANKELTSLKQANIKLVSKCDTEHRRTVTLEGDIRGLKSQIEKLEETIADDENIITKLNDQVAKLQGKKTKKPAKKTPTNKKGGSIAELVAKFIPDGVSNTGDMRGALTEGYRKANGIGLLNRGHIQGLTEYLNALSSDEISRLIKNKKEALRVKAKLVLEAKKAKDGSL